MTKIKFLDPSLEKQIPLELQLVLKFKNTEANNA